MNQLIAQRLKAIGAALISGVGAYVVAYLVQGQQFTLHGLESAVALAVTAGLGVHAIPNATKGGAELHSAPENVTDRLALLPKPGDRKLGHLPSPRDDRDHKYKVTVKAPTAVHNAVGLVLDALGNLTVGDCAEAGEEHGRQLAAHLRGLTYTPTTTETLALYSAITGYKPGQPSTDNGTVLRQMLSYLKAAGVITEYQAVALDAPTLKAAITEHGFVLCGFALPAGAETESVKWRVPRTGKAAGSWGGHCVPLPGFTAEDFDVISWGELGTASAGFVKDYIDEAWVITYADSALK